MSTWTLEEQKAHRKLWAAALRSGKYQQGQFQLQDTRGRMCCLGVLADISGCEWSPATEIFGMAADGEDRSAPLRARNFVGLATSLGSAISFSLMDLNDGGESFATIANIIESEPLGLFIEATP
ncbi:MAG: hypothetical protein EKK31_11845 [Hyphomicrobiales bacterium]|nr:MAG: hypothetical protein EKK31_11845 [Hyphomicrobiales bacterium]